MRDVATLLNAMRDAGVVRDYALFGAAAQMRYTEAVVTLDADVLIAVPDTGRLDVLSPIYDFCRARGLHAEGEAVRVGGWPVQFVPVFDDLTREALESAETADFEGEPFRVVGPAHLAVIALATGRAKDFARILAILEAGVVTKEHVATVAARHGLASAWSRFAGTFLDDPH